MAVNCCRCGEPWDQYYLRHELTEDEKVDDGWEFGNNVLHIKRCSCCPANLKSSEAPLRDAVEARNREAKMQILSDCFGDDLDGIASMQEDMDFMDLFDE